MGRGDDVQQQQLRAAKRAYKTASLEGHHEEEAKWANVVGDLLKRRGEYVEALRWLRLDYEVSSKYLPEKQLLPTCQSLGELYLRLQQFKDALFYQKKHLELAKDADDLVEQQRASTQLGRTYHEMFLKSENDHFAVRNANKYFNSAMTLARTLKDNPPPNKCSFFVEEFIDAHNNIGMLEMDLDNLDDAQKILLEGLKLCDDEEVNEDDDVRSRLHHNLGSLYMELREWGEAKKHIDKDILICNRIGHLQGEAKGYINLGELNYRRQKYDEAIHCYQRGLDIARTMEDEDALVDQINQNIETVNEAVKVMEELKKEEQKLKRLMRATLDARGKPSERKCLLEQNASLDCLIEKSSMIFAWTKHREFAKRKKKVATDLCDKEKLGDSFLAIGEAHQKLRNYKKSHKWYMKSWKVYQTIGNVEGQALAKINIGEVLDSSGDWAGALEAFKEGYRISVQGNLLSVQMSALNNMHYSQMIRFDNVEEARKLQNDIENLKHMLNKEPELRDLKNECYSETETEGIDTFSNDLDACDSPRMSVSASSRSEPKGGVEGVCDDTPLASLIRPKKKLSKTKITQPNAQGSSNLVYGNEAEALSRGLGKTYDCQQSVGHKRVRVILSDDEDEGHEMEYSRAVRESMATNVPTTDREARSGGRDGSVDEQKDVSQFCVPKDVLSACAPGCFEESSCSYKSKSPKETPTIGKRFGSISRDSEEIANDSVAGGYKLDFCHASHAVSFKIGHDIIHVDACSYMNGDTLTIEQLKAEVACRYYLWLSAKKRSKGLLPVIHQLKCCGKDLGYLVSPEDFKDYFSSNALIEVVIEGWVPKHLMKLYIDCCMRLCEEPNMKLLSKLYNLEVSEDEVLVSDCELQDISISPFLDALHEHTTIAVLDISHNSLGNQTMEKLQQIFTSSNQKYGGLTLDLHCNRLGPTSLFQVCECPVLIARLEVLNLSENRLTDACASYLSTILQNCKALYSLNIQECSITSRTIQKIADALPSDSVLAQLSLGKNNPISGNAMVNLLSKIATLQRFSELNLNGIKLSKLMVDGLCQLAGSSSLSGLMLGGTNIGSEGAVRLTEVLRSGGSQDLVKLDMSSCGLTSHNFTKLLVNIASIGSSILELNLGGNSIGLEGCTAIGSLLLNPDCPLKVLILDKCHLGISGIVQVIQAVTDNSSIEELRLAENADLAKENVLQYDSTPQENSKSLIQIFHSTATAEANVADHAHLKELEVADSEDDQIEEPTVSGFDGRNTFSGSQLIADLCRAIGRAKHLQLLDLSKNGFSAEVAETLYFAWCSSSRSDVLSPQKHINDQMIHFSVEGKGCCGVRICCRKD
ncbi:Protein TONSOKU [Acorus gramineus]|uniref:Protein TONSOKU n=1 Tax=Acorus gramineus TaxID=55184 RepID=A0AAV9BJ93_ACOGR|nr:Protein TONSOKU [Acorus gramineus]